jgi:predicted nucleic acid-binding protein
VTTAADRILVDTNVLVYACLRLSPLHGAAIQALHTELLAGTEIWVSRQVLREYLAVLTRPKTTTLASPAATAAADVSAFQRMFFVADDTADVTSKLVAVVQSVPMGGKQVTTPTWSPPCKPTAFPNC